MHRTLGLDWGDKRIGVAASDPLGLGATPLTVVLRRKDGSDLKEIARLAAEQDADRVIVGVPWSDDGSANESTTKALAFAESLRGVLSLPVETFDESYTTDEANRILKAKGLTWQESKAEVDRLAAAVMLQSWLDSRPRAEDPE